jgi:hypothetical protein
MTAAESVTNKFGSALSKLTLAAGAISIVLMAVSAISTYMDSLKINLEEAGGGLASFREAIYKDTTAWKNGADAISTYSSTVTTTKTEIADWATGLQSATGAQGDLTDSVSQTTDEITNQTLALGENATMWLANAAMQDDVIQNIFKDFYESGMDFGAVSKQAGVDIASMVQAALALPGTGAAEYVQKMFNAFALDPNISESVREKLLNIAAALDATTLSGVQNSKTIKTLMGAFGNTDELDGFGNGLEGVAEKVYTLTDYVSDLGSLLSAAFTIRYGLTESIDKMATSWKAVGDRLSEAKKQMQAINQEISGMTADRNVLEYQLSIALKYGDTLRADKIRAEIAAKTTEITGKQEEYSKAAQDASTRLTGMSPGAIANRETMRSMVQDYNSRMTAYANEYTASTNKVDRAKIKAEADRLKADFIAKAQSLGFAKNELAPYIKSFGDLKTIVNKLPNTLTLKVNADPGMRAWLEWWAKNKNSGGTAIVTTNNPGGTPTGGGGGQTGDPGNVLGGPDGTGSAPTVAPKVTTTKGPNKVQKKADTTALKDAFGSGMSDEIKADFTDFRDSYYLMSTKYGGALTPAQADKKFGGDAAKMKNWQTLYKKYSASSAKLRNWNFDTGKLMQSIDMFGKDTRYDPTLEPTEPGRGIYDSVNYKKRASENLSKLSAPIQEAIKWLQNAQTQYKADKSGYEVVREQYADAKERMGLDRGKTWANILKENGPNGTGVKEAVDPATGKKVKIVDYLQAYKDSFTVYWQSLINNATTGQKYREMLRNYPASMLSPFFPNMSQSLWYDKSDVPKSAGEVSRYAAGGLIPGNAPSNPKLDNMFASSPNGTIAVRSGEYIQNQQAVKYYGVDFMNAVNRMQLPRLTYTSQSSGSVNVGNIVVELSPNAVMQLMAMSNRPINLYSDDRQIASSANRGNRLLAMRGSN